MRRGWVLACLLSAASAFGHGTPIDLNAESGSLRVSHADNGYALYVIGQSLEDSDPQGPLTLPDIGSTLLWGLPGIDIHGVSGSASLSLEILAPAFDGSGQTLWYWDPSEADVAATPDGADLRVLLSDRRQIALRASDSVAPPATVVAAPLTGQTGFHNHDLMNFAMPYDGSQAFGLYGFFSRFVSDSYSPSEWFLTVFNLGVSHDQLVPASSAIWGAAFPGDYDRNGIVDAADHSLWAGEYGLQPTWDRIGADGNGDGLVDAADYTVWRDHAASTASTSVPEPATLGLLLLAAIPLVVRR